MYLISEMLGSPDKIQAVIEGWIAFLGFLMFSAWIIQVTEADNPKPKPEILPVRHAPELEAMLAQVPYEELGKGSDGGTCRTPY